MRIATSLAIGALTLLGVRSSGAEGPGGDGERSATADLYPHPVITEVLFNVPQGERADANADGQRHPASDEFVELFNPHPKSINLRGYAITNRITTYDEETKRGVRFVFPSFTMEPGAVVVVFNGFESRIPGPVGTAKRPPAKPNEHFEGAWVFMIDPGSRMCAFANAGDFALLSDSRGNPIDGLFWGEPDPEPPSATIRLVEVDDGPNGSVQRTTADAEMIGHRLIDRQLFSPGQLPGGEGPGTSDAGADGAQRAE